MARLLFVLFGWLHRALVALAMTWARIAPSRGHLPRVKLLVRLDEFGDAVMTTALVSAWAAGDPSSVLVVAPKLWAPVYALIPGIRVLAMPARSRRWRRLLAPADAVRMGWRIRRFATVDVAIVPRAADDPSWAILVALIAGAARRVGFNERATSRRQTLNRGMDRALTECVARPAASQHELDDLALLLGAAGTPIARPLEPSLAAPAGHRGVELLASVGIDPRAVRVAAILPSAGNFALKAWPIAQAAGTWRQLADAGYTPVMLGSAADIRLADALAVSLNEAIPSLAGRTTVGDLAAVLAECALAVGADTGAMHLAAALGLPAIGLYGPTNAEQFGLRGRRSIVLQELLPCSAIHSPEPPDRCRRCVYDAPRCMSALTPDRVLHALPTLTRDQVPAPLTAP